MYNTPTSFCSPICGNFGSINTENSIAIASEILGSRDKYEDNLLAYSAVWSR
jgi:hypothetical protein